MNLTPKERELLRTFSGPRSSPYPPSDERDIFHLLRERRLVEPAASMGKWQLTPAGRAALAGEAEPARDGDTINPEAWAALLRASRAYDTMPGHFVILRTTSKGWDVEIWHPHVLLTVGRANSANINEAIRAAVAQAEGQEGGA